MKKLITFFAILIFSSGLSATTLEAIIKAFAIPSSETWSANDWASINDIRGIKWHHKGLRETPSSSFSRSGIVKLDKLGLAEINFSGVRTMVEAVELSINEPMVSEGYKSILTTQFPTSSQIKTIRDNCKDEGLSLSTGIYEITLPYKKPVYIFVESSSGASGMDGTTSFNILLRPDDKWECS